MCGDAPIFVTGMPRSGTTFLQHLLSRHPQIAIHGQEPAGVVWASWLQVLLDGLVAARQSNVALDYAVDHYAGRLDVESTRREFLAFIRHYLVGDDPHPRWGLKSLRDCRLAAPQILQVWPRARWVVCIREPFRSIESLRNTFDREELFSVSELCTMWTETVEFGVTQPQATLVQIDRLASEDRLSWVRGLFRFLEEDLVPEVEQFVAEWPKIHEVATDAERTFRLSPEERRTVLAEHAALANWRVRLGYDEPV